MPKGLTAEPHVSPGNYVGRGREEPHLTVRAGRGAAVGVVAESVDVEAALGVGIVAGDVPADLGWGRLGLLLQDDGARDLGVTTNDGN